MVVLDVVEEVRVPGVSHQRVEDIRKDPVYESILLVQNTPHVDVLVHEQGVRAHVVKLHSGVEYTVPPAEVVEQVQC